MKKSNKKALYENVMAIVAKEIKKALNEKSDGLYGSDIFYKVCDICHELIKCGIYCVEFDKNIEVKDQDGLTYVCKKWYLTNLSPGMMLSAQSDVNYKNHFYANKLTDESLYKVYDLLENRLRKVGPNDITLEDNLVKLNNLVIAVIVEGYEPFNPDAESIIFMHDDDIQWWSDIKRACGHKVPDNACVRKKIK